MKRLAPILAILLLAAAFRIVNTGHWTIWTDEGWSTWAASDHHFDVILDKVVTKDRHPPLFTLALSAWWTVAGDSRIALRFLAIAGGLITVAALYRLCADVFNQRAALYAALLLAVLPSAVYYAEEIRQYSWLVMSVSLMSLFFLRYLRTPRLSYLIGYTFSIALMLYSLYLGIFFLLIQVGVGILAWHAPWRHKAELIGAWIISLVLYSPWLLVLPRQLSILGEGIFSLPTSWTGVLIASSYLFSGQIALIGGLYVLGLWKII